MPSYFDNLNSWLGQIMQRDCPQVPLEIVDVETTGYVLRLCPFESILLSSGGLTEEDLEAFIECVEIQCSILNATVRQRDKFMALIAKEPRLEHVEIPHWAGLGGVRYVPPRFRCEGQANRIYTTSEKMEVNEKNIELVSELRSLDSAFSLGENSEGLVCVRFGMVSMETDVEELLNLVVRSGTHIEQQAEQQETELADMSAMLRASIDKAQEELRRESDAALWQEGLLRHVPLVGSLYNWLSPAQKAPIKGRSLTLTQGKLESTEAVYSSKKVSNAESIPDETQTASATKAIAGAEDNSAKTAVAAEVEQRTETHNDGESEQPSGVVTA